MKEGTAQLHDRMDSTMHTVEAAGSQTGKWFVPRKAIIAKRPCLISAVFRRKALESASLARPRGSNAPPMNTASHSHSTHHSHSGMCLKSVDTTRGPHSCPSPLQAHLLMPMSWQYPSRRPSLKDAALPNVAIAMSKGALNAVNESHLVTLGPQGCTTTHT